MTIEKLSATKD